MGTEEAVSREEAQRTAFRIPHNPNPPGTPAAPHLLLRVWVRLLHCDCVWQHALLEPAVLQRAGEEELQ